MWINSDPKLIFHPFPAANQLRIYHNHAWISSCFTSLLFKIILIILWTPHRKYGEWEVSIFINKTGTLGYLYCTNEITDLLYIYVF